MKIYRSAIDWWLVIVLAVAMGFSLMAAATTGYLIVDILIIAFIVHLYLSTYYKIEAETLTIRASFLVNNKVDIHSIAEIKKTMNPLSSPALSIKRISIVTISGDYYLLSPKRSQMQSFLSDLREVNPKIKVSEKLETWAATA